MCIFEYLNSRVALILLSLAGIAPSASPAQNSDTIYATPGPELISEIDSLHARVQYPNEALEECPGGRLVTQMIVKPDGSVDSVEVLEAADARFDSLSYEQAVRYRMDEEAVRVVKQARFRWTDDWPDDRERRMRVSLPVIFQPPEDKCHQP
jgi:Gram-negative bacterial tonB protein.